jgi:L-threonylcarbamoyladenylate synthase
MPGPLTVILPKKDVIPPEVTAGLDSVAVRCPIHETARYIIEKSGVPIAAPSANKSGMPSPTTANHVYNDMNGKIPLIIDAGACEVGVESTVIKITDDSIILLRPGAITAEMLGEVCPNVTISNAVLTELKKGEVALSPGMKYKHYAPKGELYILDGNIDSVKQYITENADEKTAVLTYDGINFDLPYVKSLGDANSGGKLFFDLLRECDDNGITKIFSLMPDKKGVGFALYNRMFKAAGGRIIKL